MSAFFKNGIDLFSQCLQKINYVQLRSIAKSPGQSQKGVKRKQRIFGLKKNPGDRVDERTIIGTQKYLKYFPGYNVGINPRDKSLYSICAGTIYYSIEQVNLNPQHPLVKQFFLNKIHPYYKKFIHVVPDKLDNEFRLIDIV